MSDQECTGHRSGRATEQGPSGHHIHPTDGLFHSPLCTGPVKREFSGSALTPEFGGEIAIFSSLTVQGSYIQESTGQRSSRAAETGFYQSPSAPRS